MRISKAAQITIFLVSFAVIIAGNHLLPLLDWDEANFGEIAREMIISGNYLEPQIAYDPFYEKPPLFFWMQSGAMHLFGINEFSVRLPVAIFGALTLLLLYRIGANQVGHYFGSAWVLMYAGSLHFMYFKTGLIDPVFNYFILLSIYYLFKQEKLVQENQNARLEALIVGLFAGIAVLIKGPVALLVISLIWLARLLFSYVKSSKMIGLGLLSIIGLCISLSLWIVPLLLNGDTTFFLEFFNYQMELAQGQIEWHNQPWYYHIVVLLFVCFPASIFCWPYLFKRNTRAITDWDYYMSALFWLVLIVFSLVTTKIVHYSSLCWFPITYFAAKFAYQKFTQRLIPKKRYFGWGLIIIGVGIGIVTAAIPIILGNTQTKNRLLESIPNTFAKAQIGTNVDWPIYLTFIGILFTIVVLILGIYQLRQKGYSTWISALTLTFIFGQLVYFLIVPKITEHTQGAFINKVKQIDKEQGLQYNWEFKTYAMYFYGGLEPKDKQLKKEGRIIKYTFPEKGIWNWATELSSQPINRDLYLWFKGNRRVQLDSNWTDQGKYNGYLLYKRSASRGNSI